MISRRYTAELDGIRALAVWLVMLFHAGVPLSGGGWVGVDVFFVLSGFLITTLLMDEHTSLGKVSLSSFWVRRALRLLPAYFAYLIPITFFFFLTYPPADHVHEGWSAPKYLASLWLYVVNFAPLSEIWEHQYLVGHLWSLAVEQQFYLALCLLYLLATGLRISMGMVLGLCLISFATLSHMGLAPGSQDLSLFGRGNSLLIGCLVAVYAPRAANFLGTNATAPNLKLLHAVSLISAITLLAATLYRSEFADLNGFGAITPFSSALYLSLGLSIAGYWYGWSRLGTKLLANEKLVFVGKISYGIYVYHLAAWAVTFILLVAYLEPTSSRFINFGLKMTVYFLLTHLTAWFSYKYIEVPFLKLKRRVSTPVAS